MAPPEREAKQLFVIHPNMMAMRSLLHEKKKILKSQTSYYHSWGMSFF